MIEVKARDEMVDLKKQSEDLNLSTLDKLVNFDFKSAPKAIYSRKDGKGNWVLTRPLPADPYNMIMYFKKGFKAPETVG